MKGACKKCNVRVEHLYITLPCEHTMNCFDCVDVGESICTVCKQKISAVVRDDHIQLLNIKLNKIK